MHIRCSTEGHFLINNDALRQAEVNMVWDTSTVIYTDNPVLPWNRCIVDVADIDHMNILQAALKAMEGAVAALPSLVPDYLLVDGNQLPKAFSKDCAQTVVRGDSKSTVIAAASILAKVCCTDDLALFHPL